MLFTPDDVVNYALDRSGRTGAPRLPPDLIARQFTGILRTLVRRVLAIDKERLAFEYIVDASDVAASSDDVDLTSSGTRDWMTILGIDWRSSSSGTYDGEVVVGTQEARQRLYTEFAHLDEPIAYFFDGMNKLKKVWGWDTVYDLRIYGVLVPDKLDPQAADGFAVVLDYPQPVVAALESGFLLRVAPHLKPTDLELKLWASEHQSALEQMDDDATGFVDEGLRIEDVPHKSFYD